MVAPAARDEATFSWIGEREGDWLSGDLSGDALSSIIDDEGSMAAKGKSEVVVSTSLYFQGDAGRARFVTGNFRGASDGLANTGASGRVGSGGPGSWATGDLCRQKFEITAKSSRPLLLVNEGQLSNSGRTET